MSRAQINRSVELRQVYYFVTLAEELNFRRAAERLYITQPSLSHQIALLERTLGLRLFHRDRRRVELTGAGKAILDESRRLLTASDALVVTAERLIAEDSASLRVGFPEYTNRTLIPEVVARFRSRHPEVKLALTEGYSRALIRELRQGRLDLAFIMLPPPEDLGNLQVETVIDETSGLLLAAGHRLAACSQIAPAALAHEQLLLADRSVHPAAYDVVDHWLQRVGVQPRFFRIGGSGVYTYDTALQVIQSGEAMCLGTVAMARDLPDGVVFRPFVGSSPHFQVAAVWSATNSSTPVLDFLSLAREVRDASTVMDPVEASSR